MEDFEFCIRVKVVGWENHYYTIAAENAGEARKIAVQQFYDNNGTCLADTVDYVDTDDFGPVEEAGTYYLYGPENRHSCAAQVVDGLFESFVKEQP